jgi:hypothetical protein
MQDKFHQAAKGKAQQLANLTTKPDDYHPILRKMLENPNFFFLSAAAQAADPVLKAQAADAVIKSTTEPSITSEQNKLETFILQDPTLLAIYTSSNAGPGHTDPPLLCGYFDAAFYKAESQKAEDKNGFNEVRAHFFDFGPSVRFFDSLDLGVGAGFVTIQSKNSHRNKFETNPPTFVPVRVVLRPVLMFVPEHRRQQWMGVVDIFFKETYIAGEFDGADFGASNSSFHVKGELVRSFGLNLDVTALIPRNWYKGGE